MSNQTFQAKLKINPWLKKKDQKAEVGQSTCIGNLGDNNLADEGHKGCYGKPDLPVSPSLRDANQSLRLSTSNSQLGCPSLTICS